MQVTGVWVASILIPLARNRSGSSSGPCRRDMCLFLIVSSELKIPTSQKDVRYLATWRIQDSIPSLATLGQRAGKSLAVVRERVLALFTWDRKEKRQVALLDREKGNLIPNSHGSYPMWKCFHYSLCLTPHRSKRVVLLCNKPRFIHYIFVRQKRMNQFTHYCLREQFSQVTLPAHIVNNDSLFQIYNNWRKNKRGFRQEKIHFFQISERF